jgi:hypothetical protein
MMKPLLILFATSFLFFACRDEHQQSPGSTMVKSMSEKPQAEFADAKFTTMGKQLMKEFETGDIQAFSNAFADNAVYAFSAGDSLVGRKAIFDFWQKRRHEAIKAIQFSNDIWLPIQVNQPQKGPDMKGIWLLNWYMANVTYNTDKSLTFWVHTDYHFNTENQIDRAVQYIDRAPINAATQMVVEGSKK